MERKRKKAKRSDLQTGRQSLQRPQRERRAGSVGLTRQEAGPSSPGLLTQTNLVRQK